EVAAVEELLQHVAPLGLARALAACVAARRGRAATQERAHRLDDLRAIHARGEPRQLARALGRQLREALAHDALAPLHHRLGHDVRAEWALGSVLQPIPELDHARADL